MSLARNSALAFTAQIVSLGLSFIGSIVVSRWLGPEGRGVLSLLVVLSEMAAGIATWGLGPAYAYLAGKSAHRMAALVGSSLILAAGLGLISGLGMIAAGPWLLEHVLRGLLPRHLAIAAVAMPFVFLTFFLSSVMLGSGRVREAALMQVYTTSLSVVAGIVVLPVLGLGLEAMVVVFALTAAIGALWYLMFLVSQVGLSFRGLRAIARDAFTYGFQAYLGSVTGYFWLRADVLILNAWAGPGAVGQYTLATHLGERIWLFDTSIDRAVLPEVIKGDEKSTAHLVARTARNLWLVTGVPALLLALAAPWLVPFVYGEPFRPAVLPLILLLPGIVALAVSRVISSYFSGQLGRPIITSMVSLATMITGIVAYLALIPGHGAAGAALGSTIAYIVPMAVYVVLFPRVTGLRARDILLLNSDDRSLYPRLIRRALGNLIPKRSRAET